MAMRHRHAVVADGVVEALAKERLDSINTDCRVGRVMCWISA